MAPVEVVAEVSCCGPGALGGGSPPLLPADTPLKVRIDRLMPRTGLPVAIYYGAVVALLALAGILPRRPGLAVDGLAALAAGSWCALNTWRCRHAPCAVSGAGGLRLCAFTLVETLLRHSALRGND